MHTIIMLVAALGVLPVNAAPAAQERTLRHAGVVHASPEELWSTFTTPEGWTSAIGVAKSEINLRLGGTIRSVYDPKSFIGDDSTITNTIIAYEPGRMLALRATAPANAPDFIKSICETGWTVIRFEPLTPERTRLVITGMGFRDTELHRQAYDFFDKGNAWTLKKVQDHFAEPDADERVAKTQELLFRLEGDWSFSKDRPDGSTFGGETHSRVLFDGTLLVADGFLTIAGKTFQHSHFMAGLHPETGTMRAWSVNETGDVTEGEVRLAAPESLVIDWSTHQRSDRAFVEYRVEYNFRGPGEFQCRVLGAPEPDGTRRELVDVTYTKAKP